MTFCPESAHNEEYSHEATFWEHNLTAAIRNISDIVKYSSICIVADSSGPSRNNWTSRLKVIGGFLRALGRSGPEVCTVPARPSGSTLSTQPVVESPRLGAIQWVAISGSSALLGFFQIPITPLSDLQFSKRLDSPAVLSIVCITLSIHSRYTSCLSRLFKRSRRRDTYDRTKYLEDLPRGAPATHHPRCSWVLLQAMARPQVWTQPWAPQPRQWKSASGAQAHRCQQLFESPNDAQYTLCQQLLRYRGAH